METGSRKTLLFSKSEFKSIIHLKNDAQMYFGYNIHNSKSSVYLAIL